jgi:hypothetical protein
MREAMPLIDRCIARHAEQMAAAGAPVSVPV